MDILHKGFVTKNAYTVLREAGYIPIHDRASGKQSFILRLTQNRYPRFHVYVEQETDDQVKWHLHLDHRQHGWGQRLHDTEYDGEQVQKEGERLKRWLAHFTAQPSSDKPEEEKGFFSRLFG